MSDLLKQKQKVYFELRDGIREIENERIREIIYELTFKHPDETIMKVYDKSFDNLIKPD